MDVISWTGRTACALQAAMRATNEDFANRIGVAVRTVASWHQRPDTVPRAEIQEALDTVYGRAPAAVLRRFNLLTRPTAGPVEAQALRVAIAVVVRRGDVLLVCRSDDGRISWQFPAGIVKPGAVPDAVAVSETFAETGVHCSVRMSLGSRLHPDSGALCEYRLCDYLTGEAANLDMRENAAVQWVPISDLTKFIPPSRIYPPIVAALEDA
ncbi:NUDIX domain-containing protein [Streptomyces sp. NPDC002889]|uniref:NUDIX domain-containing protein n=1 Tax=Streptomyces sp. NPDC002889 TaxID=3364669 RepID=UPI0036B70A08